jgi:hypothetical protein
MSGLLRDLDAGDVVVMTNPDGHDLIVVQFVGLKSGCPRLLIRAPRNIRIRHLQHEEDRLIIDAIIG